MPGFVSFGLFGTDVRDGWWHVGGDGSDLGLEGLARVDWRCGICVSKDIPSCGF